MSTGLLSADNLRTTTFAIAFGAVIFLAALISAISMLTTTNDESSNGGLPSECSSLSNGWRESFTSEQRDRFKAILLRENLGAETVKRPTGDIVSEAEKIQKETSNADKAPVPFIKEDGDGERASMSSSAFNCTVGCNPQTISISPLCRLIPPLSLLHLVFGPITKSLVHIILPHSLNSS
uniref:Col_cuticle_N domain-containing protein n=1 Tax=Ascaris lumbricoides TaxID=6252 RepID=A0A0M3IMC1_ASCLU